MAARPTRCVVLWAAWSILPAAQSPVVPTDLPRIRSISALDLFDDGSKAVFAVRSIDGEEYRNRLYSIDLTRPAPPVPLTAPTATTAPRRHVGTRRAFHVTRVPALLRPVCGVVYANPSGSAGYGEAFQYANFRDWGTGPAGDVLAALDDAMKLVPEIDKDQFFLTGGSYAGYLTTWIAGHDKRFQAAASQRGVYDLRTFYGEGNAFCLAPEALGLHFWEPAAQLLYDRESPIAYVHQIAPPLLILHGSADLRTGVTPSEMLYRALKQLGRPVEYIRYPNAGHELTRGGPPTPRLDHALRILEFFERYRKP